MDEKRLISGRDESTLRKPCYEDLLYLDPVGAGAGILLGYSLRGGLDFQKPLHTRSQAL